MQVFCTIVYITYVNNNSLHELKIHNSKDSPVSERPDRVADMRHSLSHLDIDLPVRCTPVRSDLLLSLFLGWGVHWSRLLPLVPLSC